MEDRILLGFEIGSGTPVYLPLHHLAIFGMTQKSGKTTALEALITRAGIKAIAFITKRGEGGFSNSHLIMPYYKPRADWQFVEGLVNVALGEKVKYEPGMRYGIMQVCKGTKDLKQIQEKAKQLVRESKRDFMKSVYEKLAAYLEIVIPELEKWVFTEKLELSEGINVMDLSGMRLETQHLVIASTVEYAFAQLDHVIVIIPEAWETIPQGKMTPVKWVAQQFIRKGAALGNYLWLDSQDIGGIDKTPLRQCDNWIMGRMKEAHEVKRILKQLIGADISEEDIQHLDLGNFYAAIGNDVKKVYVLPAGVPESVGIEVAMGKRSPESVREEFLKKNVMEGDEMYREKAEQFEKENQDLKQRMEEILKENRRLSHDQIQKDLTAYNSLKEELQKSKDELQEVRGMNKDLLKQSAAAGLFKEALSEFLNLKAASPNNAAVNGPSAINLNPEQPAISIHKENTILDLDSSSPQGKIAILYSEGKLPEEGWFTVSDVFRAFEANAWNRDPRTSQVLDKFCQWGFLEKRMAGTRPEYRIRLPISKAKEQGLIKGEFK
jgi:hypothetical protein